MLKEIFVTGMGYTNLANDCVVFVRRRGEGHVSIVLANIDDLIFTSSCPENLDEDIDQLLNNMNGHR